MSIIEVKNLGYTYPGQAYPALNKVNMKIEKGEIWALIGRSGCGKSTLIRAISRLVPDFYGGMLSGEILFQQRPLKDLQPGELYRQIGVVSQDAEHSLIFSRVKRDIAFGLENLGLSNPLMNSRIREILDYLDLNDLSNRAIENLSGGEKQKVALAGILAMQPRVLILDEPTASLDPAASRDFWQLIRKLNKELAITIIIAEQNLKVLNLADKAAVLEAGEVVFTGTPPEQKKWADKHNYPLMPSGKADNKSMTGLMKTRPELLHQPDDDLLVTVKNVSFTYKGLSALHNIDLQIPERGITALIGDNGAGKSTLIKIMLGLIKADIGQISVCGLQGNSLVPRLAGQKVAYLPQRLDHFFMTETVLAEVKLSIKHKREAEDIARYWLEELNIIEYADADPRSLSTGEKQRAALAAILAGDFPLILLDEPTRGLDMVQKKELGQILTRLTDSGKSILMASHDMDFVSSCAQRVLMLQKGRLVSNELINI